MNRKSFVGSALAIMAGGCLPLKKTLAAEADGPYVQPPFLQPGDLIGITSPAGHITIEEVGPAASLMKEWGYEIRLGQAIGKKDFGFGGTDEERRADLQQMLDDPKIKAIMCARGGYGAVRIVDGLDWRKFIAKPKWIIGFSDITVLHNHIHTRCRVASIHSKMTNSFPDDWTKADPVQADTILSIRNALAGKPVQYPVTANPRNRPGAAGGILVGGNLKTLESVAGTPSDIDTAGKILFVEDTGEYLYSIDRMFWNLKRTGKLAKLKGLVVGGFKIKPDDPGEEFGRSLFDIVLEKVKEFSYPVCFDFPVGHQKANYAMKCGVWHTLSVAEQSVYLKEGKA